MKKFGLYLLAFLAAIQLYRPERANPAEDPSKTVSAVEKLTPDLAATFNRACADCHSHNTVWPWYSNITPASLLITHDVNEGREHLNFSTWGNYNKRDREHALEHMCKEVTSGGMPPSQYTVLHGSAKLNDQEKHLICDWSKTALSRGSGF